MKALAYGTRDTERAFMLDTIQTPVSVLKQENSCIIKISAVGAESIRMTIEQRAFRI